MVQQMLSPKLFVFNSKRLVLVFTFSIFCLFSKIQAQIVYVDSSVAVSGNGSSWANAYKELRDALTAYGTNPNFSEIRVAKGTYKPTGDSTDQSAAFGIFGGSLSIYGGYPNGGGQRDLASNKVNLMGINPTTFHRTFHVFVIAGIVAGVDSVVLDGLVISNGVAIDAFNSNSYNGQTIYNNVGPGLCLQNNWSGSKIIARNCAFTNNTGNTGAGVYSSSTGSLILDNCTFNYNTGMGGLSAGTNSYGAGLYNYQTATNIRNCSFSNNTFNRSGTGIGIYNENSSITIINTSFINNSGPADGGAIANVNGATADISHCIFSDNAVRPFTSPPGFGHGSGIYNLASTITLHHSSLADNSSYGDGALFLSSSSIANIYNVVFLRNTDNDFEYTGGGAISNFGCAPMISNCLFYMNSAGRSGGAMYNAGGASPLVSNCLFYKNFAEYFGGAVFCADSSGGQYRNCIFWQDTVGGNFAPGRYEFFSGNNGNSSSKLPPAISYSIIKSPFPILNVIDNGNNSNLYPQFFDPVSVTGPDGLYATEDDGLRLQPCSPGIDAGLNSAIFSGITTDLKDDDRVVNAAVDMGPYENESPAINNTTLIGNNDDSTSRSVYNTLSLMNDCRLIATISPAGTSPVTEGVKAKVTIDASGNLFDQPYVRRYYDIEPAGNAGNASAIVSLYFTQAEFDAYNLVRGSYLSLPTDGLDIQNYKANIVIHQFHGISGQGSESVIVPSTVMWSSNNNWWVITFNATGFSRFYVNTSLTTLPVVLEYFRGNKQVSNIHLTWKVNCSNTPSLELELQKSSDGNAFTGLYNFSANERHCLEPFSYTDVASSAPGNYYRLKISEASGKITYSNILFFDNSKAANIIVPGNIRGGQPLNIVVPQKEYTISIFNSIGSLVKKQALQENLNSITLNIGAGVYFYRIADRHQQVQKVGQFIVD